MAIGTIYITTNQQWTISTNVAWIPALPLSGSGNYEYTPIPSANGTGAYRSGTITITYQDGTVETLPIVQFQDAFLNAKVFVLGLDDDAEQYVKYRISLADGRALTDTNTRCGEELDISGYPQSGIVPITGDTVSLLIYTNDDFKTFSVNFSNAAYWLSTNTQYDNGEDVISAGATAVTLASLAPNYSGSFVFTRTGDYLYIVLDYRNIISCASGTKIANITRSYYPVNIDVSYGASSVGLASLGYTLTNPYDVAADYDDATILADESSATGGTVFFKSDIAEPYARMVVSNGDLAMTGDITITMVCPALTGFTAHTTSFASATLACADAGATATRYHNGVSALPDVGDIIYTVSSGATPLDGNDMYYLISTFAYQIDDDGTVVSITNCVCAEVAIPVITSIPNQYVQVDVPLLFKLDATNKPTSWDFDSPYNEYTIDGGAEGGSYTYTDIYGCSKTGTVGINETQTLYGNTFVADAYGTATISSAGAVYRPSNIFIDSYGEMGVKFDVSGTYSYSVIATNCFGDSAPAPVTFVVKHAPTLAPFQMIPIGYCNDTDACASTEPYQDFWFNNNPCEGTCNYPEVNDLIFIDGYGEQYLNGGYLYYMMDNNDWILIDGIGQVIERGTC